MPVTDALRRAYAPTGTLRAALNHGNRVLVSRDAEGRAQGITVDLAQALADDLGLDLTLVEFERAVDVSSRATGDVWDICFLAVDPKRAETIWFTHPYIRIEGSYLVAPSVTVPDAGALVAESHRIGTVEGSAYTLHLMRQEGAGNLVSYPDIFAALAAMDAGEVAGIAGVREAMAGEAALRPGSRVLEPPFMEIRQAMGMPTGRPEPAAHLAAFLGDLARSGRVGEILERHGVSAECAIVP